MEVAMKDSILRIKNKAKVNSYGFKIQSIVPQGIYAI